MARLLSVSQNYNPESDCLSQGIVGELDEIAMAEVSIRETSDKEEELLYAHICIINLTIANGNFSTARIRPPLRDELMADRL